MDEVRLIDANKLQVEIENQIAYCDDRSKHQSDMKEVLRYANTSYGLRLAHIYIDTAPTVTPELPTEVKKALEVLKRIEQNRWVPVSERLPEENICDDGYHEPSKWVLVQARNGHMYTTRYWTRDKKNVWTDLEYPDDIVAWQELPQPYKEDTAE